ncbi:MAG: HAD hydrolase-like protein [Amylibacter sp.]|nr:HAD hydrolase-like protein [Amylibacter sp.]
MLTTHSIFERYEEIRKRMPKTSTPQKFQDINSLLDIAEEGHTFVFDAFGVLNVGETLIPGADKRLDQLRSIGCNIRILTNAASYDRNGAIDKFKRLGLSVKADEIVTSRDATLLCLTSGTWGAIAAPDDHLSDISKDFIRIGHDSSDFDCVDGFVFLSSFGWTNNQQKLLTQSLLRRQRPVLIANADLVAPRDNGFSLEPGNFGHLLLDQGVKDVSFFGKPFPKVYDLLEQTLSQVDQDKIIMCGDSLHTDVIGAAARGWKTVLVTRDGLFAGFDTRDFCKRSNLYPDWRLPSI